jgi:electron transport complex protein RnfA
MISLFIAAALTQNVVLSKFLGMCSFFEISKSEEGIWRTGISIVLITLLSSLTTYFIYYNVLVPSETGYLKTIVFILVILIFTKLLTIIVKYFFKISYELLGNYLPLIATNCAIFGVILLNISNEYTLLQVITYALGSSIGYILIIYVFETISDKMEKAPILRGFRGLPIALITLSIMALVFTRYIAG